MLDREPANCQCGCGQAAPIAKQTNRQRGTVRGQPQRYIWGHAPRSIDHTLTGIDEASRTANCSKCGSTAIYRDNNSEKGWRCSTRRGVQQPGRRQHRISAVNVDARIATCAKCGPSTPIVSGGSDGWVCALKKREESALERASRTPEQKAEAATYAQQYYVETKGAAQHKSWLKRYHLTPEEYAEMLVKQGNACAICHRECRSGLRLGVDHDHRCCAEDMSCGKCVRGLLCRDCNRGLGFFGDDVMRLKAAISYLSRDMEKPLRG